MLSIPCKNCKKDFPVLPSRVGKIACCSKACSDEWRKKTSAKKTCNQCEKEYNSSVKASRFCSIECRTEYKHVSICCAKCKNIFVIERGQYTYRMRGEIDRKLYCSIRCRNDDKQKFVKRNYEKTCPKCFLIYTTYDDTQFCCSKKCSSEYRNLLSIVDVDCDGCGMAHSIRASTLKWKKIRNQTKNYCSVECYRTTNKRTDNELQKTCSSCGNIKDILCFHFSNKKRNIRRPRCTECRRGHEKEKVINKSSIKTCSKCHEEKYIGEFGIDKSRKDGYRSECKRCKYIKRVPGLKIVSIKALSANETGKIEESYYKICASCKEAKLTNEFHKHSSTTFRSSCKKCVNAKNRKLPRPIAIELVCLKCNVNKPVAMFKSHRARVCTLCVRKNSRKQSDLWKASKIKTNITYKLRANISGQLRRALKSRCLTKDGKSIMSILNYTADDLRKHLEGQFYKDPNMSWDNYGTYWHIDHIKPQALFIFDSMEHEECKACWELSNLQPLEAKANMLKSDNYDPEILQQREA